MKTLIIIIATTLLYNCSDFVKVQPHYIVKSSMVCQPSDEYLKTDLYNDGSIEYQLTDKNCNYIYTK
jgi:hypothetical protein